MEQIPNFQKALRGYAPEEVDAYIRTMLDKQESIMLENSDLKDQLLEAIKTLQPAKENADKIANAAARANAQAERILEDAKDQARSLMKATETACEEKIAECRHACEQELSTLIELQKLAVAFREALESQYQKQMDTIHAAAEQLNLISLPDEAQFRATIMEQIRLKISTSGN